MPSIDPVRGPKVLPRFGRLRSDLRPQLHEAMVLRSRDGRLVELPRGAPPTFGQRLVGGFIEAYYVSVGAHTRTFASRLPTADVGIELQGEVDVELEVKDCGLLVRERRGDLNERLRNWCLDLAGRITAQHNIGTVANAGDELARLASVVADSLRTTTKRPDLPGMTMRELRVRLRYADEATVQQAGKDALQQKLQARKAKDLKEMYEPVYGPDIAGIVALLTDGHTDRIPDVVDRIHASQQLTEQRKIDLFQQLVTSPSIEVHVRDRLAQQLARQLGEGDGAVRDFTAAIFDRSGDLALQAPPADRKGDTDDEEDEDE
ncbi:hypothetical protein [Sphaerisporangium fuscum]|uniref:hypothetical protein n=1 Tax=Sphaerisporangium fuscum TaxID=2835868 RepID=UPI001BDCBC6F|nr:hypothetical protein [Sphaerisporangium fuscum]